MEATTILDTGAISAIDFRCAAGPADAPFTERHVDFCLSYVRRGTFGYSTRGESFELVAGSILVGCAGDEFVCSHDHHEGGDECLSFHYSPAQVEILAELSPAGNNAWRIGGDGLIRSQKPVCGPRPPVRGFRTKLPGESKAVPRFGTLLRGPAGAVSRTGTPLRSFREAVIRVQPPVRRSGGVVSWKK
jgi:hypothetical protein